MYPTDVPHLHGFYIFSVPHLKIVVPHLKLEQLATLFGAVHFLLQVNTIEKSVALVTEDTEMASQLDQNVL